jgi:hypothetical protein
VRFRPVPKFYFHLINDMDVPDEEGQELPDLAAARAHGVRQAQILIGEMAKEEARIVLHHRIDIEDEEGTVLDTVRFRDVVSVED